MPVTDYQPTVKDVAKLLRARTRDDVGNLVGDFVDGTTTPGGSDAQDLIQQALDDVGSELGADIDESFWPAASRLVAYLAAANIEMSFFPEQAAQGNSMYDKLMARYTTKLKDMQEDIAETEEDEVEQMQPNATSPSGGFPEPMGWGSVQW